MAEHSRFELWLFAFVAPVATGIVLAFALHKLSISNTPQSEPKIVIVSNGSAQNAGDRQSRKPAISRRDIAPIRPLETSNKKPTLANDADPPSSEPSSSLPEECVPHIVSIQGDVVFNDDRLLMPRSQDCLTIPAYSRFTVVVETCNGRIPSTGGRVWGRGDILEAAIFPSNVFPVENDAMGYIIKRGSDGKFLPAPNFVPTKYLEISFAPFPNAEPENRKICSIGLSDFTP